MTRLQQYYREKVVPRLTQELGLKNPMEVPRITKITINMGVGEAVADKKVMDAAVADLAKISGQKPLVCKSKKSIASFKLREGLAVGCKVTLRGARMYEFLDRLISIAIPRIRDFRGVSPRSFDGRGNYSLGVKEQIIFPEIDYDAIDQVRGLDITISTSAQTDVEAFALLMALGMPFATQGRPRGFDLPGEEPNEQDAEAANGSAGDEAPQAAAPVAEPEAAEPEAAEPEAAEPEAAQPEAAE